MTDLYGILGLTPRATANEIKSAYRRLARKYHPDVSASPDSEARFVHINRAYQILSDPRRRAAYDSGQYHDAHRAVSTNRQSCDPGVGTVRARVSCEEPCRGALALHLSHTRPSHISFS